MPERPDRRGERVRRRRPLRALRRRGRAAEHDAVVLQDHRVRRRAARVRPARRRVVARAVEDDPAQLDRALGRRRDPVPRRGPGRRPARLHDAAGHVVRRDVLRCRARASVRRATRLGQGARVREARGNEARRGPRGGRGEDRRLHGLRGDEPRQRRAPADVRGGLRPDGLRHRRDHGGARARRARPRVRRSVRPSCRRGRERRRRAGALGRFRRAARRGGQARDRRVPAQRRAGRSGSVVSAARLELLAAAVLGLSDPDRPLRRVRRRSRSGGRAPRAAARGGRLFAEGQAAAGLQRGVAARRVPALRRRRDPRGGHDGHVRRFVVVLPALRRPAQRRRRRSTATSSTTGCR